MIKNLDNLAKMNIYRENSNSYDQRSLFIDCVLIRKLGMPITLSLLYLCVARRCNVECIHAGLPTHSFLYVPSEGKFVDACRQGMRLDMREVLSIVASAIAAGGPRRQELLAGDKPLKVRLIFVSTFPKFCNQIILQGPPIHGLHHHGNRSSTPQ